MEQYTSLIEFQINTCFFFVGVVMRYVRWFVILFWLVRLSETPTAADCTGSDKTGSNDRTEIRLGANDWLCWVRAFSTLSGSSDRKFYPIHSLGKVKLKFVKVHLYMKFNQIRGYI